MRAFQVFGLALFAVAFAAVLLVQLKRIVDHRAGRQRFRCSAGLVELRARGVLPRFVRLGVVRCELTAARLEVALMVEFGHRDRNSLLVDRDAAQSIRLDPIDATGFERAAAFGVKPEVLGRVVLKDGSTKAMVFIVSERDAERLEVAGRALGWHIVTGSDRLPSPLSASLEAFPNAD